MTGPGYAPSPRPLRRDEDIALVTGEAVLIDIPPAPLPHRIVSGLIDVLTYGIALVVVLLFVFTQLTWVSDAIATSAILVSAITCLVLAPMTVETLTRGRTLGKVIMRLRTVRDDGGPIVFRHAFVRALLASVEIYSLSGVPALIAALANSRVKRLGDLAAGTYVVRIERLRPIPPAPGMPRALASWATVCDIAPLPDGLSVSIRQFLLRRAALSQPAQARVAASLMAQVAPRVAPAPPSNAPDWAVLTAVLAESRRRDGLRLAADQQVRRRLLPPDPLSPEPVTPPPGRTPV